MKGGIHETSNLFGFAKLLKFDNRLYSVFCFHTLRSPLSLCLSLSPFAPSLSLPLFARYGHITVQLTIPKYNLVNWLLV